MSSVASVLHSQPLVTVYSKEYWRPLTAVIFLLGLMALSSMLTKRMPPFQDWKRMRIPIVQLGVIFVLNSSILYTLFAALLLFGVGTSSSAAACRAAPWTCVLFYGMAKYGTSWFLVERVHIVHSEGKARMESRLYKINSAIISMWQVVGICLIIFHSGKMRSSDDACVVEMAAFALAIGVATDIFVDIYFSLLFAIPLLRGKWANPRIKRLAIKSILIALISMAATGANLLFLVVHHGREPSFVCLTSCFLDTFVNATGLFVLTAKESSDDTKTLSLSVTQVPVTVPTTKPNIVFDHQLRRPGMGNPYPSDFERHGIDLHSPQSDAYSFEVSEARQAPTLPKLASAVKDGELEEKKQ